MKEKKIYIKNERFIEFIDELATQLTEVTYTVNDESCYKEIQDGLSDNTCIVFTDEAQDFYNEKYDEIEYMANNMILLHSDNDLNN